VLLFVIVTKYHVERNLSLNLGIKMSKPSSDTKINTPPPPSPSPPPKTIIIASMTGKCSSCQADLECKKPLRICVCNKVFCHRDSCYAACEECDQQICDDCIINCSKPGPPTNNNVCGTMYCKRANCGHEKRHK
jgi:hypothetical protein